MFAQPHPHHQITACCPIRRQEQNFVESREPAAKMQAYLIAASTTRAAMIISILLVQLVLLSVQVASADPTSRLNQHHRQQQQQHHHHQSQLASSGAVFDEEINFEPLYDYDKTSAVAADTLPGSSLAAQIAPDPASLAYSDDARSTSESESESPSSAGYHGDPFAATFEEYLKEASLNSANHMAADDAFVVASDEDDESAQNRAAADGSNNSSSSSSSSSTTATTATTTTVETTAAKPRETPIIDYIFPSSSSSSSSCEYSCWPLVRFRSNSFIMRQVNCIHCRRRRFAHTIRWLTHSTKTHRRRRGEVNEEEQKTPSTRR